MESFQDVFKNGSVIVFLCMSQFADNSLGDIEYLKFRNLFTVTKV